MSSIVDKLAAMSNNISEGCRKSRVHFETTMCELTFTRMSIERGMWNERLRRSLALSDH